MVELCVMINSILSRFHFYAYSIKTYLNVIVQQVEKAKVGPRWCILQHSKINDINIRHLGTHAHALRPVM